VQVWSSGNFIAWVSILGLSIISFIGLRFYNVNKNALALLICAPLFAIEVHFFRNIVIQYVDGISVSTEFLPVVALLYIALMSYSLSHVIERKEFVRISLFMSFLALITSTLILGAGMRAATFHFG
jgi:hypothetical protein